MEETPTLIRSATPRRSVSSTTMPRVTKSSVQVPEITLDEYFRWLRKTDVLGYLVRANGDLESKEARLERAETDNTKLEAVQKYLMVEHEVSALRCRGSTSRTLSG